jgi:hypothetical protein
MVNENRSIAILMRATVKRNNLHLLYLLFDTLAAPKITFPLPKDLYHKEKPPSN